jgi:hypothetical protein
MQRRRLYPAAWVRAPRLARRQPTMRRRTFRPHSWPARLPAPTRWARSICLPAGLLGAIFVEDDLLVVLGDLLRRLGVTGRQAGADLRLASNGRSCSSLQTIGPALLDGRHLDLHRDERRSDGRGSSGRSTQSLLRQGADHRDLPGLRRVAVRVEGSRPRSAPGTETDPARRCRAATRKRSSIGARSPLATTLRFIEPFWTMGPWAQIFNLNGASSATATASLWTRAVADRVVRRAVDEVHILPEAALDPAQSSRPRERPADSVGRRLNTAITFDLGQEGRPSP